MEMAVPTSGAPAAALAAHMAAAAGDMAPAAALA
jgi:hypothetical protein